jgi:hypothetical protein
VTITPEGASARIVKINQRKAGASNETSLGTFRLGAGKPLTVSVGNEGTDGCVIVDGLQLLQK